MRQGNQGPIDSRPDGTAVNGAGKRDPRRRAGKMRTPAEIGGWQWPTSEWNPKAGPSPGVAGGPNSAIATSRNRNYVRRTPPQACLARQPILQLLEFNKAARDRTVAIRATWSAPVA